MRKLVGEKEREEKRVQRNKILVGVVLIGMMFLSTLGYAFRNISFSSGGSDTGSHNSTTVNFRGYDFSYLNNYWVLNKEGKTYIFSYNPKQVPRVDSEINLIDSYKDAPLAIKSDSAQASSEIRANLNPFVQEVEDVSEVNCKEKTTVIVEISDSASIEQVDKCVYIKGQEAELVPLTDEFLLKILSLD